MADDIIDRLRCAYRKGEEPPCEACTFCAARAEVERLRAAGDEMAELILAELPLSLNEENFKVWFSVVKWQKARCG